MESNAKLSKIVFYVFFVGAVLSVGRVTGQGSEKCSAGTDIENAFYPTGYMGDGEYGQEYVKFNGAYDKDPNTAPTCIQISYTFGPKGWAGIYWQNKPDNWGDLPGNDYSKKGFKKIVFFAKGQNGDEVVEFKAGGINDTKKPYHDSFEETLGRVTLSKDWKKYTIDVSSANLSSVIGGFCWVASRDFNSSHKTIIFQIDNIYFE
jgi:hypothetical protein